MCKWKKRHANLFFIFGSRKFPPITRCHPSANSQSGEAPAFQQPISVDLKYVISHVIIASRAKIPTKSKRIPSYCTLVVVILLYFSVYRHPSRKVCVTNPKTTQNAPTFLPDLVRGSPTLRLLWRWTWTRRQWLRFDSRATRYSTCHVLRSLVRMDDKPWTIDSINEVSPYHPALQTDFLTQTPRKNLYLYSVHQVHVQAHAFRRPWWSRSSKQRTVHESSRFLQNRFGTWQW